jgi:sec-independent protein translocase protein TatC
VPDEDERPLPAREGRAPARRPGDGESARQEGGEDEERPGEVQKTFLGHLMELRGRIIACIVALVVCMGGALVFYRPISRIVRQPVEDYNLGVEEELLTVEWQATALQEAFVFVLKLGLWSGLVLASPIIAWQAWSFVSPGLYPREKRAILPVFTLGVFFFAGGAYFAYRLVMPLAISFFVPFAAEQGAKLRLTLGRYMQFFLAIHLAFGVVFETPLVIMGLARVGLVTARALARRWQYAVAGAFIVGAFLTPPDVVTQIMMAGSLIVLYLLSIALAWLVGRRAED